MCTMYCYNISEIKTISIQSNFELNWIVDFFLCFQLDKPFHSRSLNFDFRLELKWRTVWSGEFISIKLQLKSIQTKREWEWNGMKLMRLGIDWLFVGIWLSGIHCAKTSFRSNQIKQPNQSGRIVSVCLLTRLFSHWIIQPSFGFTSFNFHSDFIFNSWLAGYTVIILSVWWLQLNLVWWIDWISWLNVFNH